MRSNRLFWRLNAVLALFLLALAPPIGSLRGATAALAQSEGEGPVVRTSVRNDTSPALRGLALLAPEAGELRTIPSRQLPKALSGAAEGKAPGELLRPSVPVFPGAISIPAPLDTFEGIDNVDGVLPPDTNGDVGPDHYVQMVNSSFAVYDRAGTLLVGPSNINTLFSGFGGPCEATNDGDPIVLYDHLADRWLLSQFALPSFPNGPYYECIAISQSPDPTGAWHRYEFLISNTKLDDYPKFGVWPDGYYMSVNQFVFNGVDFDWGGAGVVAFERDEMLAGNAAQSIYFDVGAVNDSFGGMLPSDLDGAAPPASTPNYFVEWDDSAWLGDPTDTLRVWEFVVDWDTPLASTFGANASLDPNATIATANVEPNMCGYARNCIPQPGGSDVDAISDRLMFRLQYRDFGTHQTLVSNHTVDADGTDHAGIHWFELRDTGSGWGMYQQGVYAPDAHHRWMGSVAMDGAGNIALGYSVSSATVFPSIRYTGRLASDPLGTLPQGEGTIIAGSGYQEHISGRWGDYSMMAVDPVDDRTFWYTQEYYEVVGQAPWQTRVGSFMLLGADLSITKTADLDSVSPGMDLTYTLTVENDGPDAANVVTVDDTLPSGVTLVTVTPSQGGCASLPCSLGVIASGGTATVTVVVHVEESVLDPVENTAEVSSSTADPDTSNNSDTIETEVIHVYLPLVMKSPPGP